MAVLLSFSACSLAEFVSRSQCRANEQCTIARVVAPAFMCIQTQNAATTNRANEMTKSERRSCITALIPCEMGGAAGWATPCREYSGRGDLWSKFRLDNDHSIDIAASQRRNETRLL